MENINPIVVTDYDLNIAYANDAYYQLVEDKKHYPIYKLVHKDDIRQLVGAVNHVQYEGISDVVVRFLSKNKDYRYFHMLLEKNYREDMLQIKFVDYTYLEEINQKLVLAQEKQEQLLSLDGNYYLEYNRTTDEFALYWKNDLGRFEVYNTSFAEWKERMQNEGKIAFEDLEIFERIGIQMETGTEPFEYVITTSILTRGEIMETTKIKAKVWNAKNGVEYVLGTWNRFDDINDSKMDNFIEKVYKDPLTGVLNKKEIIRYIEEKLVQGDESKAAFVIMDIDDFKEFNDTYGHMFGDEIVKSVASIIKSALGSKGQVGRIGGDEFLFFIENIEGEMDLRSLLRAIRSNIQWLFRERLEYMPVHCSFGAVFYPEQARTYKELFQIADKCLYIAKEKGKNRYIIYDKELHGPVRTNELESSMIEMKSNRTEVRDTIELGNCLAMLYEKGLDGMEGVLACIQQNYELDRIVIYQGDKLLRSYYYNPEGYDRIPEAFPILSSYEQFVSDRNVFELDNTNKLEFSNHELYTVFHKQRITSVLQYVMRDSENRIIGIISYERCKIRRRWASEVVNMLTIVSKIIETVCK